MAKLTPAQRDRLYLQEAERTGIHQPILAALYTVHQQPALPEAETGLGISPANRISLNQVNTFDGQVRYAANTIRSQTNSLTVAGWKGTDIWNIENGRYTDKFVQAIAAGYTAPASDPTGALLESSNQAALLAAYLDDVAADCQTAGVAENQRYLDQALLAEIAEIPRYYTQLSQQREALLELVRIWHKLDTRDQTISLLNSHLASSELASPHSATQPISLDQALLQFVPRISSIYSGYPHQREALLQLVQRWQQFDSREATIVALEKNISLEPQLALVDSALIALLQRIPQLYEGRGDQRNALVEGFRNWQQLEQRSEALVALGVNPDVFAAPAPAPTDIVNAAIQLDRALLEFIRQLPVMYQGTEQQRHALIYLTQLWRGLTSEEQAIQSLFEDLRQMETARRNSPEAPPIPKAAVLSTQPEQWTPTTIQMYASIMPNGSFTWAEATQGGLYLPPNQATVDAIVRMAQLIQQVRDRLDRPIYITAWYYPNQEAFAANRIVTRRHLLGDAVTFYCDGLTGNQLYWFLDPWWVGGLGRYTHFPYLCYIDAHSQRARWLH